MATPVNLQPILFLCSVADQHQKKKIKSRIHHLSPHCRIKPGTCHLATSPFSRLSHLATSLPPLLPHLSTSSPPTPTAPMFPNLPLYSLQPTQTCRLRIVPPFAPSQLTALLYFLLSHYLSHLPCSLPSQLSQLSTFTVTKTSL